MHITWFRKLSWFLFPQGAVSYKEDLRITLPAFFSISSIACDKKLSLLPRLLPRSRYAVFICEF
jgi:hypothetical protein